MKNRCLICTLLVLVLLPGCGRNPIKLEPTHYIWKSSTPEAQGMSSEVLDSAFVQAESMGYVDGLLVIRNGFIVAEDYHNGYSVNAPHNVMSVSKSFLSAIAGIALQQDYIDSLEEKMLDYFPEYVHAGLDERKFDITLRHLLTMRMGIDREEDNNYELYFQVYSSDNWTRTTIELPLVYDPGERMRYNTFQTHLLSAIITRATGRSTLAYATDNLFRPMGIDVDSWERDPQGYYFGGNSMHFTPREMATLGLLYLNGGRLNGEQIVPADWVELSLTKTLEQDQPEWGVLHDYNYGYLWWIGKINEYELYMALGYGGQLVLVFPDLDLIVVSTANENIPPDADQIRPILAIVSGYVLPAVTD